MPEKEKKEEPFIIKAYLIVLFFCGIGLWFASHSSPTMQTQSAPAAKQAVLPKQTLSVDVDINNKVIDVLTSGGVSQTNIVKEYATERSLQNEKWNEFYKTVRLLNKHSDAFEESFRKIARMLGVGLSRTDNPDGSVTYKFFSTDKNYSNITLLNPSKSARKKGGK